MAFNRSYGGGYQYSGFPALIFLALREMGTHEQTLAGRLNTTVHIFAYIRATVPEKKDLHERVQTLISETDAEIIIARETYKATYEDHATYSDEENKFCQILDGILYRETEIIALTKLIDNERMEAVEAPAGS